MDGWLLLLLVFDDDDVVVDVVDVVRHASALYKTRNMRLYRIEFCQKTSSTTSTCFSKSKCQDQVGGVG